MEELEVPMIGSPWCTKEQEKLLGGSTGPDETCEVAEVESLQPPMGELAGNPVGDILLMQPPEGPMVVCRETMRENEGPLVEGACLTKDHEIALLGSPESAIEFEQSLAGIPGLHQEQELSNLGRSASPMDGAPGSVQAREDSGCSAEESQFLAVALPLLDSREAARTEAESLGLKPTVSAVLRDTDVSEELDSSLNEKKRKRKNRCRIRKKKKKSEATDIVDTSWLAELPFSNTDIGTIFEITSQSTKTPRKRRKQRALKENKDGLKENKTTPNYFISLPITNPKIVGDIEMIQESVLKKDDRLSKAMVPHGTLHITLFVMHLANEEDVDRAVKALLESKGAVEEILQGKSLVLSFEGVADFRNEVIFVKLVGENSEEGKLSVMRETLEKLFKEKGILPKESKSFSPHLTFIKLSRSPKIRKQGLKKVDLKLYEDFKSHYFGEDTLTSLDLCSMLKKRQPSGYYHCESSITFGPVGIPGTNECTSTRLGDSEDPTHSRLLLEQHFEMLPSSIVARKSVTPTTSSSDHTSKKHGRGLIAKALRQESMALRSKVHQIKELLANPDIRAKMYKEVCGLEASGSPMEPHCDSRAAL